MDDLERELRDVLTSGRRALPPSLVPLERVHARAARRRRRRAAVAGTAAALAVLAAAGTAVGLAVRGDSRTLSPPSGSSASGTGGSERSAAPATTAAGPSPTSVTGPAVAVGPAWGAARVTSVTATSTRTVVVLGALGDTGACTTDCLRLAESHDGGSTFSPLPVPADATTPGRDGAVAGSATDVRFGNGQDGWLYGDGLWSTHDGGHSWRRLHLPGRVLRLEAAAGSVWTLVDNGSAGGSQHLFRADIGSDTFSQVPGVVVTGPADLAVQGARVVVAGAGTSRWWVGGRSGFVDHASPCPGTLQTTLSAAQGLWAVCVTGTLATVAVSPDGVGWSTVHLQGNAEIPNSAALGARTATDALVGQGVDPPLVRLGHDGNVSSLTAGPRAGDQASYVGFTTPQTGYAVVGTALWRTDDGGDTWRRLSIG